MASTPAPQPTAGKPGGFPDRAMRGAVDLGALAAAREAARQAEERSRQRAAAVAAGSAAFDTVIDVTAASFQADVLERSMNVPVVIDLWATWCGPCKQLSPILGRLADEAAGAWLLAKIDVDAEQEIAAAFRVQSVPAVVAVIKGQPVPLFTGAIPEAQIRQYLAELLKVASENGVTGSLAGGAQGAPWAAASLEPSAEPAVESKYEPAYQAFEAGDWAEAERAFRAVLDADPGDKEAAAGLVRVDVMRRTDGVDGSAAMAAADAAPTDLNAALVAADSELISGDPAAAFRRLVGLVGRATGSDRDAARAHLIELFEIVGLDDPTVARARIALANALF